MAKTPKRKKARKAKDISKERWEGAMRVERERFKAAMGRYPKNDDELRARISSEFFKKLKRKRPSVKEYLRTETKLDK